MVSLNHSRMYMRNLGVLFNILRMDRSHTGTESRDVYREGEHLFLLRYCKLVRRCLCLLLVAEVQ